MPETPALKLYIFQPLALKDKHDLISDTKEAISTSNKEKLELERNIQNKEGKMI